MVNKGNVTGFAKLLEVLPAGFTATAGDLQGASFSFADQKAKFVWVSMPSQTEFKISYKVAVATGTTGSQNIDGVFSFIENDETKKFVIATSTVTVGTGQTQVIATNTTTTTEPIKTTNTTEPTTTAATTNTTTAVNTNTTTATNTTATTENTKSLSATNTIPASQGNVNYKVQIAALHNAVNANVLATRYNISTKVNTEMADGFTKYTVGSHNDYKEARDAREDVRNKGVAGPFVTAYNSGKRITVQEALMITSQKWFR
jgi:cell division septation protein DedD